MEVTLEHTPHMTAARQRIHSSMVDLLAQAGLDYSGGYVNIGGNRVHYLDYGEGEPVLLHTRRRRRRGGLVPPDRGVKRFVPRIGAGQPSIRPVEPAVRTHPVATIRTRIRSRGSSKPFNCNRCELQGSPWAGS